MKPVLILGTGAQAKYATDIFLNQGRNVIGLLGLPGETPPANIGDIPVIGGFDNFSSVYNKADRPDILVCCANNIKKEEIVRQLDSFAVNYTSAIHPRAVISKSAVIGEGTIVNACAVVQPFAKIGCHVMVHAGAIVEHDCCVNDFVNIAPRATLTGHVRVGKGTTVFAGSVVLPSVNIGDGAVVGAGAVVRNDVSEGQTVVGCPAVPIKQFRKGDGVENV